MSTRKPAVLFAVLAALLLAVLAACAGSQAPGAGKANPSSGGPPPAGPSAAAGSPTLLSTATPAEIERIAHQIFPGPHPVGCNWRDRTKCPVTDRLAARLDELTAPRAEGPGPSPPLCRCQNGPNSISVRTEATAGGGRAHGTLDHCGGLSNN